ncbi:hypothetical protein [Ochrobactrum sp. MYb379]|uniref:hypothetical protein n=1 Tax=Ochrobactrum sp. MYb379 TaxID=2745275 RepID=UPI0030B19A95
MNNPDDHADNTEQIVDAAKLALAQSQPAIPVTLRGVVHALSDDITKARKNGLRWEDIAEILRRSGCANVKADTVRSYHRVEPSKRSKKVANAQLREQELKRKNDAAEWRQNASIAAEQTTDQPIFENEVSNRQQGIIRPVRSSRVK